MINTEKISRRIYILPHGFRELQFMTTGSNVSGPMVKWCVTEEACARAELLIKQLWSRKTKSNREKYHPGCPAAWLPTSSARPHLPESPPLTKQVISKRPMSYVSGEKCFMFKPKASLKWECEEPGKSEKQKTTLNGVKRHPWIWFRKNK